MTIRVMKNNMSLAIVAIVAVTALLVATSAVSSLTNQAYATTRMNAAQSCVNEDARCQDVLSQIQGHDNAGTVTGNQP